ncbi:MAG: SidA/IucD/PvdA family monooxygenase [Streptosporangiales bacterium]|nr:SidA/IucD/PvdA family monooxygenase [Streptosporangiales bacterium]
MVLFQLSGNRSWLREPYLPTRIPGMSDHDDGGLSPDLQQRVRNAAATAVLAWDQGRPVTVPAPRGDLLTTMLSVCMGEQVAPDFEPMMAEELGFAPARSRVVDTERAAGFPVVVIGAGVSGLAATVKLRELGVPVTVLEKNATVGGTWLENRYPGAGVDTPSHLYSFSYFPRRWTAHFAKRDELARYLEEFADHFELWPHIRLRHEVTAIEWDDTAQRWTVTVVGPDGGTDRFTARAVVTAVGQLNRPAVPDIEGAADFTGPVFHSARWPDGLDVTGKRVAVVGTGASAMQIVPAVADRVASLTVYQRSPQWVAPNANYFEPVSPRKDWLITHVPYYRAWYRVRLAWTFNDKTHASLQIDPDWGLGQHAVNAVNDGHRTYFTRYLMRELDGRPDLQAKTLPDYPPFGKRMLLDNGWFKALRRPNVELVTAPVTRFTRTGVETSDGRKRPADVVVFATGFEARKLLGELGIRGRSGRTLRGVWGDDDAYAYLGITVPDFPNLFLTYGPHTNLGHGGSYITVAECQVRYIVDLVAQMIDTDITSVEPRADVTERYNRDLDDAHARMIWTHPGMDTWYRNRNGRVVTNSPWRIVDYWALTRRADLDDFVVRTRLEG